LEGEEVEPDQSPEDASPSSPKSFQALYTQVAQLLQQLQAAHQQEMAQPQELTARRRKPKPRANSEKRKKAKNVGISPNVVEVKMAANEEVEEKGPAEHVHIGRPSCDPISLEKLHMMTVPDVSQEARSTRSKIARLSSVNSFAGFADYCSGQAKSLMKSRSMQKKGPADVDISDSEAAKLEERANMSPREKCRSDLNVFVRSTSFKTICALVIIANTIHLAVFSDLQIKSAYDAACRWAPSGGRSSLGLLLLSMVLHGDSPAHDGLTKSHLLFLV